MGSDSKSLIKGFLIYILGNAGTKFIGLFLLPLYTHNLTNNEYGIFEILNTAVLFFLPVVAFQISEGLLRYILNENNFQRQNSLISSTFAVAFTNLMIFDLLILLASRLVEIPYILPTLAYFNFHFLAMFFLRIARGLQKRIEFALGGFITGIIIFISSYILIKLFQLKTEAVLWAYALGNFVTSFYLFFRLKIYKRIKLSFIDKNKIKEILKYSFPLLFDAIFWWGLNLSNRLILGFLKNPEAVSIFGVAAKFSSVLVLVNSVFYLAWQEYAIIKADSKDSSKDYANIFNYYFKLQFTGIILLLPLSKLIIELAIGDNFQSAWKYLPFLLPGAMLSSFAAFYGLKYQTSKKTLWALITSIIGAVVNISVNFTLIPFWGIYGSAFATFLSFLILWLIRLYKSSDFVDASLIDFNSMISLTVIFILFSLMINTESYLILTLLILISLVNIIFVNRKLLIELIKTIKEKLG